MTRSYLVPIVLLTLVCLGFAALPEAKSLYRNAPLGISIEPPEFPDARSAEARVVVHFFLPPEEGFAPNLGIQVQQWSEDLDAYAALSEDQFKTAGFTVRATRRFTVGGKAGVEWDYEGHTGGRQLRFLAWAVQRNAGEVVLLTGTASKANFSRYEKALRKSLESLRFLAAKEPSKPGGRD